MALRAPLVLATIVASHAQAQEPASRPTMRAEAFTTIPTLDGDVSGDVAWSGFEAATGFRQIRPDAGEAASEKTEVYIGYTDDTLYIGVIAHDRNASSLIVDESRRDASLENADAFLVIFDSMLDRRNGFVFGTNPAGMQYDGQVVEEGSGSASGFGVGGINLNWAQKRVAYSRSGTPMQDS